MMHPARYRYTLLFAALSILCLCFIFGQSLLPAKASNSKSDQVIEAVQPILNPQEEISHEQMDFLVRKSAHLTEFLALGLCLAGFSAALTRETGRRFPFLAPFLALAAAVTDEFLQSFLDRTSSIEDVLIDFIGAMLGCLAVSLAARIRIYLRTKKP